MATFGGTRLSYDWTPERTNEAIRLRREGRSSAQIAAMLGGGLSRNAVIGRLVRVGEKSSPSPSLPRRLGSVRPAAPRVVATSSPKPIPAPIRPIYVSLAPIASLTATTSLLGLKTRSCRWPIGDPQSANFGFCGRERCDDPAVFYCDTHREAASGAKIKTTVPELIRSCKRYA